MRRVVVFAVLISLLSYRCISPHYYAYEKAGNPLVVSARIGETVDPEEREKYGLFQGIDNFEEARFYRSAGGGYEVHIKTENRKLVVCNRDQNGFWILREYIDKFEEILESREEFEAKWEILDYDDHRLPITMEEINRHRGEDFSALACVGTSLFITGISFLAALSILSDFNVFEDGASEEKENQASFVLIAGTVVGILMGIVVGKNVKKRISIEEALGVVKEARKPYVVEYFFDENEKSVDESPH